MVKFVPKDLLIDNKSSINTDIMNFLSIDCSTETASLFIKVENKTFSKVLQSDKFINDLMVKYILDFIAENDLKFEDLSKIFVNQGPGSFSRLRTSLAIAKGISISRNIQLYGYDNFRWSCIKFYNKKDIIYSLIKIREKYFIQKFDKKLNVILQPKEIAEKEMGRREIKKDVFVVSGGLLGQDGDILVDNYSKPNQIYGIADGSGDIKRDLSKSEEKLILNLKKFLNTNNYKPLHEI